MYLILILYVQEGKQQPISTEAVTVGLDTGQNFDEEQYNAVIKVIIIIIKINIIVLI